MSMKYFQDLTYLSIYCVFSFQANYKINAAKLYYEIYSLSQRLRLTTIRVEHEEEVRTKVYFYVPRYVCKCASK